MGAPAKTLCAGPTRGLLDTMTAAAGFGFGGSALGNLYAPVSDGTARETVDACWDLGVRYFDTAPHYGFGLSERRLGDALRPRARDTFVLSTKVGRRLEPIPAARDQHSFRSPMPFEPVFDYSYDGVLRSFEHSLQRLGLSRVDVLLMHDIGSYTHGADADRQFAIAMEGGYRAMERLRSEGQVAAIGLGVNETAVCEASFAHADFDLFLVAGCYTLLDQSPLDGFFDRCSARGTAIIAAGVFNSGILATGVRHVAQPTFAYELAPDAIRARVLRIEEICDAHHVPLSAAALRFAAAHPAVDAVLVGAASPAQVEQTARHLRRPIPPEFWSALREAGMIRRDAPLPD